PSATGLAGFWKGFEPLAPGFLHAPSPDPYRFAGAGSPGVAYAEALEKVIVDAGPQTVAAVVAEPVQGAGGVIVPPPDYFPLLRKVCDKHGVLLIADEVITGFGRQVSWSRSRRKARTCTRSCRSCAGSTSSATCAASGCSARSSS